MKTSWIESLSQWNPGSDRQPYLILGLGHPILMHGAILLVAAVLLMVAATQHRVPLLVITVFMLVVSLVSQVWSRLAFRRLSINMTSDTECAFHGETVTFNFELTNQKALFLPWLEICAEMPYRLHHGKPRTLALYARKRLRWATSVAGGSRIRWQFPLECLYRGDYTTGPLRLRSGDIFGLFPREMLVPCFKRLLVYPEIISLEAIGLPPSELIGDKSIRRNIYEDTSRIGGSRNFVSGDPLKRINWKGSARVGQLQVKQFESSTSLNLLVILDVGAFSDAGESAESSFELAVSAAASSAYEAEKNAYPFGIIAGAYPEIRLPVGSGRAQLIAILEALARVDTQAAVPLETYLRQRHADLTLGSTLLIISRLLTPKLLGMAYRLRDDGHVVALALSGQTEPLPEADRIKVFCLKSTAVPGNHSPGKTV